MWQDSGLVVVDWLGRPVRPDGYSDRFAELCQEAGVPRLRLHNVRHSVALMLHQHGVAPADSAALLATRCPSTWPTTFPAPHRVPRPPATPSDRCSLGPGDPSAVQSVRDR